MNIYEFSRYNFHTVSCIARIYLRRGDVHFSFAFFQMKTSSMNVLSSAKLRIAFAEFSCNPDCIQFIVHRAIPTINMKSII